MVVSRFCSIYGFDMFLPTHTPLLSLSPSLSRQQPHKVRAKAKAKLSSSSYGLPKHSTALLQRAATNFAAGLFLLSLCHTVACGLFHCLTLLAGLLLTVTPFVL